MPYHGFANWHTWHVVRQLADVSLIDVAMRCTPDELRWLVHHNTTAVANGVDLTAVDWKQVADAVARG